MLTPSTGRLHSFILRTILYKVWLIKCSSHHRTPLIVQYCFMITYLHQNNNYRHSNCWCKYDADDIVKKRREFIHGLANYVPHVFLITEWSTSLGRSNTGKDVKKKRNMGNSLTFCTLVDTSTLLCRSRHSGILATNLGHFLGNILIDYK